MDITNPELLGFSTQRLARIRPIMQAYIDQGKLAGIATLIARRGQVVHFETCGMRDIEARKPVDEDTIYYIYSMTKPITSAALMMLLEEGRLRLNDPVEQYIPAFKDTKVLIGMEGNEPVLEDQHQPMQVKHLLTHTSGLSYGFNEDTYIDWLYYNQFWPLMNKKPEITLLELIDTLAQFPLTFQPGTAWLYSVATDVVGCLVQIISGIPFERFLQERIFDPLGMVDTGFMVPPAKKDRLARIYGRGDDGNLKSIKPPVVRRIHKAPAAPSGGGGLVSTARDYMRFTQMLLNRGELDGERLLGRKTVELMTMNNLPPGLNPDDPAYGFGLGGSVLLDAARSGGLGSVGNFAWGGAANTHFWVDYQEDLIGLIMLQFMPGDTYPVKFDFKNLVYQALVN